jgi:hypothetical protein
MKATSCEIRGASYQQQLTALWWKEEQRTAGGGGGVGGILPAYTLQAVT